MSLAGDKHPHIESITYLFGTECVAIREQFELFLVSI